MFLASTIVPGLLLIAAASVRADDSATPPPPPGFWSRVGWTFPIGAAGPESSTKGWWSRNWDGVKRIGDAGGSDVFLSGFAWHLPYKYDDERRQRYNEAAWGGGYGRTLGDAGGRRRTLYTMLIKDSHFEPQYMVGYAWTARTRPAAGMRLGAGYTAFLIGREEYNFVPVPLVLPLVSFGTSHWEVLGTYVPGHEVAYFFGRLTLP